MRITRRRASSRIAKKLTTRLWRSCSALPPRSRQSRKRRVAFSWSRSTSSLMRSPIEIRSTKTSYVSFVLLRESTSFNAESNSNVPTSASGSSFLSTRIGGLPRRKTLRPSVGRSARLLAASLYRWYSSRRRTSSSFGSGPSSSSASLFSAGCRGSSSLDLT
jgi:hypothetical protein